MWRNWQTRTVQVRVGETPWRFESSHPHSRLGCKPSPARVIGVGSCRALPRPLFLGMLGFRRPGVQIPHFLGLRIALVTGLVLLCVPSASATADSACGQASPSAAPCTGADKLAEAAAAECRRLGRPDADCTLPLGHQVSSAIVRAYPGTWLHRAAAFQYRLGGPVPFLHAQWLGTHNSFNSVNSEMTLSHGDSNQQLSLTQQLEIDVRALELDLHFVPNVAAGGSKAVVVCHGRGPDEANF